MTRRLPMTLAIVAIALAPCISIDTAQARGFGGGGFHGGGFNGGGFGGRGFSGGFGRDFHGGFGRGFNGGYGGGSCSGNRGVSSGCYWRGWLPELYVLLAP